MSPTSALSVAQLAIYAFLALPLIYVLVRHGKHGFVGWLYMVIFTVLRLTGSGLALSSTSSGATIISNVGLSPLLLGTLGILHEGRYYRLPHLNHKLEIIFVLAMHILVATAIGLIAAGASALENNTGNSNAAAKDENLLKIGIILMLLAWLVISVLAVISMYMPVRRHSQEQTVKKRQSGGAKLLTAALVSIPFVGIRVIYSVAANFTQSATLNPTTGSLAIRICLSVLPEMLIVVVFILFGLWTRNIAINLSSQNPGTEL